jgi:hypothetical protein
MGRTRGGRVPPRLRRAAERFAAWRRTRNGGRRIPEPLWQLASRLAKTYGVCRTASALGLDYYGLKKRTEEPASPALPTQRSAGRPAFVELPAATLASPGECLLEFENAVGAKLRVHLKGATIPDLVALGRSLWNAES